MAETLGSLVDKLAIKSLREFHIKEMISAPQSKFPKAELKKKLVLLEKQKKLLHKEIDIFMVQALTRLVTMKDEKLKLYNKPESIGRVGAVRTVAGAIEKLAQKNIQLWHLEDEARREDVDLAYIGEIKRKIDATNQERNDFMDLVDELFSCAVMSAKKSTKKRSKK